MQPQTRRLVAACCALLLATALFAAPAPAAAPAAQSPARPAGDRPNIVVLFLDDAGYGDFGFTGNPVIRTPNIDRMAAEGMAFTQFYSASPACTASRYALLTGRLPVRSGFAWVLTPSSPRGLHPQEHTLAEGLHDAGYATAIYGKWHLGLPTEYLPLQHGFDEYLGLPYSNDMQPPKWVSLPLIENNDIAELDPDQTELTARYTERAVDFIQRHRDEPFFLYLPYAMPHLPLHPGAAFAGRSPRGTYGDVIEELDASVGEILATLRTAGVADNTLVFFTSDNGPWIIKDEEGGSSGPFRDGKGSTWEGGVREPGIAWWPGTVPAGTTDRGVASTMDLYATALTLAGTAIPDDRPVDGQDISARLLAPDAVRINGDTERRPHFYYGPGHALHAVRHGRWKLHVKTSSQTGIDYFDGTLPLLFDLEQDPGEKWNRAQEQPQVVDELLLLIEAHQAEVARSGTFFGR